MGARNQEPCQDRARTGQLERGRVFVQQDRGEHDRRRRLQRKEQRGRHGGFGECD
jgi:hypothetical protein